MGDAADILQVEKEKQDVGSMFLNRSRVGTMKERKVAPLKPPEYSHAKSSLLREMAALTPETPPPVAPVLSGFKEKRTRAKVNAWEWKQFVNSARTDGAQFRHWVKKNDMTREYAFAKFNKKCEVASYTDDTYERYLKDPRWTRRLTDELFELCQLFDLRFIVIADRLSEAKTVEECKARYYGIVRELLLLDRTSGDKANVPLIKHPFNYEYEVARKEQLEKVYARTPEQVAEEEMLTAKLARIQAVHKRMERETETSSKSAKEEKRGQKRRARGRGTASGGLSDDGADYREGEEPPVKRPRRESQKAKPGVTLRSQRINGPATLTGQKMAKKIDAQLDQLNVSRRIIATAPVAEAYEDLRDDVAVMLDLQKRIQRKLFEIQLLKRRKAGT